MLLTLNLESDKLKLEEYNLISEQIILEDVLIRTISQNGMLYRGKVTLLKRGAVDIPYTLKIISIDCVFENRIVISTNMF